MNNYNNYIASWPFTNKRLASISSFIMGPGLVGFFVLATVVITSHSLFRQASLVSGSIVEIIFLAILGLLGILSLLWRKAHPAAVLGFVLIITIVEHAASPFGMRSIYPFPLFIAVGSYATVRNWRKVLEMSSISIVVIVATAFILNEKAGPYGLYSFLGAISFVVPASSFGLWIGTNQAYINELQQRSVRLERERELLSARAVAQERVRIARDLHDVVAHHVSLMIIQAGAIRESLPPNSQLRLSIDTIADIGRDAMEEMRRMLGVLRDDGVTSVPLSPAPGLTDIAGLVTRCNEAGCEMSYRIVGTSVDLSEAQQTCLFRVVQEALTNVVKHSVRANGSVEIFYEDNYVVLIIENYGNYVANSNNPGHGLEGMRERMALFGGTLEANAIGTNGFRVVGKLPLAANALHD